MDELNDLEADFLTINLSSDNLERINKFYLKRLELLCGLMAVENRLCDECGEGVVEEFGFKGNRAEVLSKLSDELRFRQTTPYTIEDKPMLIERSLRFSLYLKRREDNPIRKKLREVFIENFGKSDEPSEVLIESLHMQYHKNRDDMHAKRECICYQNN